MRLFAAMKNAFSPRISTGLVLTIGLALFNLGVFGLLLLAGNSLNRIVKENFEIQVYLEKGLSADAANQVGSFIRKSGFAASDVSGKPKVYFTSKENAGKKFIRETGEDFYNFLGENPLRDAFVFRVSEANLNRSTLNAIKSKLEVQPGVFEVVYMESLADALEKNLQKISMAFLLAGGLLLITVLWLVKTSIRSSVHAGRFFIRTMELVGASPWFIKKPYVLAIGLGGLLGGLLATSGIAACVFYVHNKFPELAEALPLTNSLIFACALLPVGFLLGFIPALTGMNAYQSKKLKDLHQY